MFGFCVAMTQFLMIESPEFDTNALRAPQFGQRFVHQLLYVASGWVQLRGMMLEASLNARREILSPLKETILFDKLCIKK